MFFRRGRNLRHAGESGKFCVGLFALQRGSERNRSVLSVDAGNGSYPVLAVCSP